VAVREGESRVAGEKSHRGKEICDVFCEGHSEFAKGCGSCGGGGGSAADAGGGGRIGGAPISQQPGQVFGQSGFPIGAEPGDFYAQRTIIGAQPVGLSAQRATIDAEPVGLSSQRAAVDAQSVSEPTREHAVAVHDLQSEPGDPLDAELLVDAQSIAEHDAESDRGREASVRVEPKLFDSVQHA